MHEASRPRPLHVRRAHPASVCDCDGHLESPERGPCIAVGDRHQLVDRALIGLRASRCKPPRHDLADVVVLERVEPPQSGTAEKGGIDAEIRVLRRSTDEHDETGLDRREQRVLLGAVETVDLVDEEDGPLGVLAQAHPRGRDRFTDVCDPCAHGLEAHEFLCAVRCHRQRQRRLSRSGRSPQDGRRDPVLLDQ